MNSEQRSLSRQLLDSLKGVFIITALLIGVTLLADLQSPNDGIIMMYNLIYPIALPFAALIVPLGSQRSLDLCIQFGANRNNLFKANEKNYLILLFSGLISVLGMNQFSSIIYQSLDGMSWHIPLVMWVSLITTTALLVKCSQYSIYTAPTKASDKRTILTFGISICVILILIVWTVFTRTQFITNFIKDFAWLIWVFNGVMLLASIVLHKVNYRLFMEREV